MSEPSCNTKSEPSCYYKMRMLSTEADLFATDNEYILKEPYSAWFTEIQECWIVEFPHADPIEMSFEKMDEDQIEYVFTVGNRWYKENAKVIVDERGSLWMDESEFESHL